MDKKKRQAALLKIIAEREVETQEELSARLKKAGFEAAQATISRDMKELRITKGLSENGVNCYYVGSASLDVRYNSIFAQSVISMDYAMNTVVIRCHAGMAPAACKVVDEQKFGFVVGTIAGDDTIFILTRSENHAIQLIEQLKGLSQKK
jgi:transcriptional regulator of arginine metabolism